MADLKISQLPVASTPLAGTELVPIVQGGVTDQTTVGAILTGTVPAGTGNGVAYLNASKVLSTGSNLTFDGTTLTANALHLTTQLGTSYGGTGLTSFTANGVVYASGTGTLATGTDLAYDGTSLKIAAAGATQTIIRGYTGGSYGAQYSGGVTPGNTNYFLAYNATETHLNAASFIPFEIGGTEKMRLDSSGNLGLGVTPSAWSIFTSVIQSPSYAITSLIGGSDTRIFNNIYFDGSYRYKNNTYAGSSFQQSNGAFYWNSYSGNLGAGNIPSTTSSPMTLHASGGLSLGNTTDPGAGNLRTSGNILSVSSASNSYIYAESTYAGSEGFIQITPGNTSFGAPVIDMDNTAAGVTQRCFIYPRNGWVYNHVQTSGGFKWGINGGATYATLDSTGLAVTGTLSATTTGQVGTTLGVGAATPAASGAGITFPATQSASSDANTLDDYREASYTGTLTGCTTSPTGTITYVKVGNMVTLDIPPSVFLGTSNATTMTITGAPTTIRPSASRNFLTRTYDNGGAQTFAMATMDTAGTITLYKDASGNAFTNTGAKGCYGNSVSYII